jgi:hypothetical protein
LSLCVMFHLSKPRKAKSEKRKAKSEKRKAKSEKRKAKSEKRKAKSEKRKAESGKRVPRCSKDDNFFGMARLCRTKGPPPPSFLRLYGRTGVALGNYVGSFY